MSTVDTKLTILDAAERLFADHGFAATSLRNIISDAEVNLAAVHYHFGSKEALIKAVLDRRIIPLNLERLRLLDLAEADGSNASDYLERIIEALIGPPLRLSRENKKAGKHFMKLIGRTFAEADENLKKMFFAMFAEVVRRFFPAFEKACPHLPPSTLFWRCHFLVGGMAHTMCDKEAVEMYAKGVCDTNDVDGIIRELVAFAAAGLRATANLPSNKTKGKVRK
jgi:AcrR family transcriptional regulator